MTAQQFTAARARLKLTWAGMAAALGVSVSSIARYEAGTWPIPKPVELAVKQLLAAAKEQPPEPYGMT